MERVVIFWHHVGREHGLGEYVSDLRRNPASVVQAYLSRKLSRAKQASPPHEYVRVDENTLIEFPSDREAEPFIICYRLREGLQFSLNYKKSSPRWLIDIVDVVEIEPNVFSVRDLFVDVRDLGPNGYHVLDVDDLRLAYDREIISKSLVLKALGSLDLALDMLDISAFPPQNLIDMIRQYVPGLLQHPGAQR